MTMANVREMDRSAWWTVAGFFAALLIAVFVYRPGFSGPFLLDDFAKLTHLGGLGGITDWTSLLYYLERAWSGPAGRPLSLLSFLIDHNNWPAPARDFKYTNTLLHLLNGALLFALLLRLLRAHGLRQVQARGLALFVMAAWLLHPLLVSTTLYVVQRMAMLSTMAVFAGLLGYVAARQRLGTRPRRALVLMTLSLGAGGGLGFLAKGNAALIIPLALVLEATLLPPIDRTALHFRRWRFVILVIPTVLLFAYLGWHGLRGLDGFEHRDFNSVERVMTQSRLLFEYLYFWFIPQGTTPGVLNSDITISRGILTPPTTLIALLGIVALVVASVMLRRRQPMVAAAIGFFLAGHLLESTTIPLELYFEHRNYLPSALLWLPVGTACMRIPHTRRAGVAALALIILIVAPLTHFRATTWGNAGLLALTWVRENPESQRAYRTAAMTLNAGGRPVAANEMLMQGSDRLPDNLPLAMHAAILQCNNMGSVSIEMLERVRDNSRSHRFMPNQYELFNRFVEVASTGQCKNLDTPFARKFVHTHLETLASATPDSRHHQLRHLLGLIELRSGRRCAAYQQFRKSAAAANLPVSVFTQAALLASVGLRAEALQHIAQARPTADSSPVRKAVGALDMDHVLLTSLRNKIRSELGPSGSAERVCASGGQD